MPEEGAEQDERRHAEGDRIRGVMNFVDQQVVAGFDRLAEAMVEQPDDEAGDGEQRDEPRVSFPGLGCPIQREKQCGGGGAGKRAHRYGDEKPAEKVADGGGQVLSVRLRRW